MKNKLMKKKKNLPATIPELQKFLIVGEAYVEACRRKRKAEKNIEGVIAENSQALRMGQDVGGEVLLGWCKLGELLAGLDKKPKPDGSTRGTFGGRESSLPPGIDKKQSHYAQQMHKHIKIVKQEIAEAIIHEDFPTRGGALKAIKKYRREQDIQKQKEAIYAAEFKGLYDIVVIDPPWKYDREYDPASNRIASPYPEMNYQELTRLYIPGKEDSIIWLWTTQKFILEAFRLLKEWEYEYKAILIWDKEKMGIGYWLRMQCEFCLLGINGKPLWDTKTIRDIIREPRREHSRKPEGFYKMIDKNFIGKKLDYFSRQKRKGWDNFGAEANKYVQQ